MRKIILSRKGYDDQYGGRPSIIMPDGTMISFPIPVFGDEIGINSSELKFKDRSLSDIFSQLAHLKVSLEHHVDPDIYHFHHNHPMGTFGQAGAALSHLDNQKVEKGDIFLFFGTFCNTSLINGHLHYEPMHSFHAIYGYLVVDRRVTINEINTEPGLYWLKDHPHYLNRNIGDYKKANVIYISKDFGYFKYNDHLRLTKPGYLKSYWQLPVEFADIGITYHEKAFKKVLKDSVEFRSVAKGQEFVIASSEKLEGWLNVLLKQRIGPDLSS